MRKLVVIVAAFMAMGLFAPKAEALELLGEATCRMQKCAPLGYVDQSRTTVWAIQRMRVLLDCAPNPGDACQPQVQIGETYELHIKVRCGFIGPACANVTVRGKVVAIPNFQEMLEFVNIEYDATCSFHPNWFK